MFFPLKQKDYIISKAGADKKRRGEKFKVVVLEAGVRMNRKADSQARPTNGVHKKGVEEEKNLKLEAALEYTRRGWFIIPLCWPDFEGKCACPKKHKKEKEVGKAPLLGKDFQRIRATEEQVRGWWHKWPEANLGVLLEPSKLMVVEIDSPEAFKEVQEMGIPKTLTNCSSKGYHYIFERPDHFPVTRSTQRGKSKAIDLLSSGYANLPPSTHQTRHIYHFEVDIPLAKAPSWAKWMLEDKSLLKEERKAEVPKREQVRKSSLTSNHTQEERVEDALGYISSEHYDDWLQVGMALHWWDVCDGGGSIGRSLWDKWSKSSSKFDEKIQNTKWNSFKPGRGITLGTLFDLAKDNGWTPPRREKKKTIDQGKRKATDPNTNPTQAIVTKEEREEEESSSKVKLLDFPLKTFPAALQEIVTAYAESMNASADIAAAYALAAGGIALGPNFRVESHGFCRPPSVWVGVVAPPGSAKTPVLQSILEPIDRREKSLRNRWKQELKIWEAQKNDKHREEELPRPIQHHVKTDDFNMDSLSFALSMNPEGLILDVDELVQLFGIIETSHTGGKGKSRGAFLSMWSGKPVSILRKKSDDIYVDKPFVVVCGGTQPGTLRNLELSQEDGMAQRFLWSCPNRIYKERGYGTPLPSNLKSLWNQKIEEAFEHYQGVFPASKMATIVGNEAIKQYNRQNYELEEAGVDAHASLYAKAADQFHRLSTLLFGLHLLFGEESSTEVSQQIFTKAYELTNYFLQHSKHCLNLMLSNKSGRRNHQELMEKDKMLCKELRMVISKIGGRTHTTSEWSSLLQDNRGISLSSKSLGRLLKRLSTLPQQGISIKRVMGEKSRLRYWEITEQNK